MHAPRGEPSMPTRSIALIVAGPACPRRRGWRCLRWWRGKLAVLLAVVALAALAEAAGLRPQPSPRPGLGTRCDHLAPAPKCRCWPWRIPAWSGRARATARPLQRDDLPGRRGLRAALRRHHRQPGAAGAQCRGCGQCAHARRKLQQHRRRRCGADRADNAKRYAPFLSPFVASVEPGAAALYRRFYPLFQQAYAELATQGHFNDRLVGVIDHLMAAPEPAQPPAVHLVEVKGEVPSTRPWVRAEYADESLEVALSAGQKIMVRVGLDNEAPPQRAGWPDSAAPSQPRASDRRASTRPSA